MALLFSPHLDEEQSNDLLSGNPEFRMAANRGSAVARADVSHRYRWAEHYADLRADRGTCHQADTRTERPADRRVVLWAVLRAEQCFPQNSTGRKGCVLLGRCIRPSCGHKRWAARRADRRTELRSNRGSERLAVRGGEHLAD